MLGEISASPLYVLKNSGDGTFVDTGQAISTTAGTIMDVDLGDVDGDGDVDMLLAIWYYPSAVANRLYLNDGNGSFAESGQPFAFRSSTAVAFADVDADGDLDIIEGNDGPNGGGRSNLVYYNDGRGGYGESRYLYTMDQTRYGLAVADFYNHGSYDVGLGTPANAVIVPSDGVSGFVSDDEAVLKLGYALEEGLHTTSYDLDFADLDSDGDLDLLVTNDRAPHRIYFNGRGLVQPNTPPEPPKSLRAVVATHTITFTWEPGSDAQTGVELLSYNLRVGRTPGGDEVLSAVASPGPGNVGQKRQYTLRGLEERAYYWSVQTVDTGFMRSPWAIGDVLEIEGIHVYLPLVCRASPE